MITQILFHTWQTYGDYTNNNGSLSDLLTYPASVWDGWSILLLVALYLIVLFASYHSSKRFGEGNFPASVAVAGFITMITSFIMILIPGFINTYTVVVCIVVALFGVIYLLIQKDRY